MNNPSRGEPGAVSLAKKVIISVAPVAGPSPLDPVKLAPDIIKSIDAGASVCHLHCKTKDGSLTPDTANLQAAFAQVLEKRDVIVQASTGGVSHMTIEERCRPLDIIGVETASLNGGSTNLGEAVYKNSFADIRYAAKACYQRHILPEIEVFDISMIHNIALIQKEQPFLEPVLFNLVFGHQGSIPPTVQALSAFSSFVPPDCLWGGTHFARDNWTFLAAAIAFGATLVRIGFEDSAYLSDQENASSNEQLVARLTQLIHSMGLTVATPKEARQILKLDQKGA